jgi:hypothetical protein
MRAKMMGKSAGEVEGTFAETVSMLREDLPMALGGQSKGDDVSL